MKYTPEQLMPKRYPENTPKDNAEGQFHWTLDDNGRIDFHYWESDNRNTFDFVKWFIDIPDMPTEIRPVSYPRRKPEREGRYICHFVEFNMPGGEFSEEGWYVVSFKNGNWTNGWKRIDYFIPYPLDEEAEKDGLVLWKDNTASVNFFPSLGTYVIYSNYSGFSISLDAGEMIGMCKAALHREGYDITKRQPKIAPCPNPECGSKALEIKLIGIDTYQTKCLCGYAGPKGYSRTEAIRLHNQIAGNVIHD